MIVPWFGEFASMNIKMTEMHRVSVDGGGNGWLESINWAYFRDFSLENSVREYSSN